MALSLFLQVKERRVLSAGIAGGPQGNILCTCTDEIIVCEKEKERERLGEYKSLFISLLLFKTVNCPSARFLSVIVSLFNNVSISISCFSGDLLAGFYSSWCQDFNPHKAF